MARLLCVCGLVMMLFVPVVGHAQEVSTAGTDFWFGFMTNLDADLESSLEIFVTAKETTRGVIEVPGKAPVNFEVTPGITFKHVVEVATSNPFAATRSGIIEQKGIHVSSDENVSVFAFNRRVNSADATIILPTHALGSQYYVASYYEESPDGDLWGDRFSDSEFLVVGVEEDTRVRIKPSVRTKEGRQAGRFFEVTLDQGEIYQVQAQGDLSGTLVETVTAQDDCTGQKFAVFGGNVWTRISDPSCYGSETTQWGNIGGAFAGDHLFEQMVPVSSWGRNFTVVPFETRVGGYLVRLTASRDNTIVTINGDQQVVLARQGDIHTINTKDALALNANYPIQVAQLSKSLSCDLPFNENGPGDPFMMMVSPNEQTFSEITFNALSSDVISRYFLNIVTATSDVSGVIMNGVSISDEFSPFGPDADMSVAVVEINRGEDVSLQSGNGGGFIAYVYGFGPIESFGYVAGSGLSNIDLQIVANDLVIGEINPFSCIGAPLTLTADFNEENNRLTQFDTFNWDFGDGMSTSGRNQQHTYDKVGTYLVTLRASGGEGICFIEKTVTKEIQVTEVVLDGVLGETSICLDVNSFQYQVIGDQSNAFLWEVQGGTIVGASDQPTIIVEWSPVASQHSVSVLATNLPGCVKSFNLPVVMNSTEPLDGAIVSEDVLCNGTNTGTARVNVTGGTAPYSFLWSGGNAPDSRQTSGLIKGEYEVLVTDRNGCSFTMGVTIDEPDPLSMTADVTTACMNEPTASAYLEVAGGVAPYRYIWQPVVDEQGWEVDRLRPDNYVVTVIDANNCELSLNLNITGRRPRITIPNSFTPNGDGINEEFAPIFECFQALDYNMKIFNRWGTLVFNTNEVLKAWDGTYNGELVGEGTYSFKAIYSGTLNEQPFEEVLMGAFQLMR